MGGRGKTKARLLGSGKDKEDVGEGGRRLSRYIEWGIATLKSTVASLELGIKMSRNLQNTGRFFLLKARNCCFRKAAERLERAWGESSLRPVEYGAVVLAHDVLSGGFWCEVRLFGLVFGVRCAVYGLDFGALCVVRRFWGRFWCAVRHFLGSILVQGVWCADFGANFGARCAVFWTRFWCAVCGAPILGPILAHGAPFWVRFCCAVCGAPFLGSILVRGVWCADFGTNFGARRAVFWTRFWCAVCGAPILGRFWRTVRLFWVRFCCAVCGAPFLGSILVRGVWCADSGVDFGVRCAVFWARFWCAVCGASILGSILAHGAPFWVRFCWCAAFGVDLGARCALCDF